MQMMKSKVFLCAIAVQAALLSACGSQRPAPVVDRSAATAKPAPGVGPAAAPREAKDGVYTVQRGDTLYSIALAFGVDHRDLARWNDLADPTQLKVGQALRVTGPSEPTVATVTPVTPGGATEVRPLPPADGVAPSAPSPIPAAPAVPAPAAPPPTAAPAPPPVAVAPPPKPAEPVRPADSGLQWQWPAPGKVIEAFDGPRNKGIDIAGNEGAPVLAAADGEVVYVGSAVRGYGNLVIVRHTDEFITAYAHNSKVVVQEKQQVKRGQKIAELGRSDADRPKLHFEVRHQGKPVDPIKYLPAR
jgi:lipoprotein NlpD